MASVEEEPLKTTEASVKKAKISLKDKLMCIKENITIEPELVCHAIPKDLVRLATQNLNLDKACRVSKNYGDGVCDALITRQGNQFNQEEIAVQQLISITESWKNILETVIPCFLILFIGAWSDRTKKRKICILLPIFGELLMCLSNALNVYYFYEIPLQVTMLFEALFPAVTGGQIILKMGAFAFICDTTSEESRTFRMGVIHLCIWVAGPIGSAASGILLKHIGYYGVFLLSALFYTFSIVYGFYFIEDLKTPEKRQSSEVIMNCSAEKSFLKSFFNLKHVKDTLTVVLKKGPKLRRTKMILMLTSLVFLCFPVCTGEMSVRFLYTRYRLNWDSLMYSWHATFLTCFQIFGTLVTMSFLSRYWKWSDALLGIISTSSKTLTVLTFGFAKNTSDMFVGAALSMFTPMGFTAIRSSTSKLCSKDELGRMMSVFNLTDMLTMMVFNPVYSWIYIYTVEHHASVVCYLSAALMVPDLFIFGWFFTQSRKTSNLENNVPDEAIEDTENEKENIKSIQINDREKSFYLPLSTVDAADEDPQKNLIK